MSYSRVFKLYCLARKVPNISHTLHLDDQTLLILPFQKAESEIGF